jgi:hypothetical protein
MKDDIFQKFQDFIIEQPLNKMFFFFTFCSSDAIIKIKSMLPSQKI